MDLLKPGSGLHNPTPGVGKMLTHVLRQQVDSSFACSCGFSIQLCGEFSHYLYDCSPTNHRRRILPICAQLGRRAILDMDCAQHQWEVQEQGCPMGKLLLDWSAKKA